MGFNFAYLFLIFSIALMYFTASCSPVYEDSETAASGDHHGRVQIKVYRGPSEDKHFAPWGYWVKQPHDDHHHH